MFGHLSRTAQQFVIVLLITTKCKHKTVFYNRLPRGYYPGR